MCFSWFLVVLLVATLSGFPDHAQSLESTEMEVTKDRKYPRTPNIRFKPRICWVPSNKYCLAQTLISPRHTSLVLGGFLNFILGHRTSTVEGRLFLQEIPTGGSLCTGLAGTGEAHATFENRLL